MDAKSRELNAELASAHQITFLRWMNSRWRAGKAYLESARNQQEAAISPQTMIRISHSTTGLLSRASSGNTTINLPNELKAITDFDDGITLIHFVCLLFKLPVPTSLKQSKTRFQTMEYIDIGLKLLKQADVVDTFIQAESLLHLKHYSFFFIITKRFSFSISFFHYI
jgi:hypothetical protein